MASSIKNPSEPGVPAKPTGSPRTNAVCLELNVTLRSLPGESGSPAQPIREDLRTVIIFDSGAVLRSANNLPAGLTLILSNSRSRDVVCRVVTGRSMPAVKGYVEIEFIEPVKDFWGIHQESAPAPQTPPAVAPPPPQAASTQSAAATATPVPEIRQQTPTPAPVQRSAPPPPPVPFSRPPVSSEPEPSPRAWAGTPEFDEFPGPVNAPAPELRRRESTREPKREFPAPPSISPIGSKGAPEKPAAGYEQVQATNSTSVAGWTPPAPEPVAAKPANLPATDATPPFASTSAASTQAASNPSVSTQAGYDFMSKGLMAYEQPAGATSPSAGRTPMVVGAAALVLAVVCGAVFFMHRGSAATPVAKAAPPSEPAAAKQPAVVGNLPALVQTSRQPVTPLPAQAEAQPQAQTVVAHPVQPESAVAPIRAAEIAGTSSADSRSDSSNARKQDKSQPVSKQADASTSKRPKLSNLKIGAPSAPHKALADGGEAPAPVTVAANEIPDAATSANLLTSSGRTSSLPAPPASAAPPAPVKPATEPRLISSVRPVYPQTARQANIQGSVTLMIQIDQTGRVFGARALTGPVMLRAAAEDAVKLWKYSPAQEDGNPVRSQTVVKVDFKLN
jgi:TonB family protein